MGSDRGERAEPSYVVTGRPVGRIAGLAVAALAALLGWGALVSAAIDAGRQVRTEDQQGWADLVLATAGGTVLLAVGLVLGTRAIALARGRRVDTRARGGGHAARGRG